ncbi:hypothetical protein [Prevotella histicola]
MDDQKTNAWRKSVSRFTDAAHSACQTIFIVLPIIDNGATHWRINQ